MLKCTSSPKILAAAPSNSAADLLAVKLLDHVSKSSILRLNASSRDWSQVHENQDFRVGIFVIDDFSSHFLKIDLFEFAAR